MANAAVRIDEEDEGEEAAPHYPFRVRLKAWWEGENAADVFARKYPDGLEKEEDDEPSDKSPAPRTKEKYNPDKMWVPTRIDAAQMVWGKGFIAPGDEAYLFNLVNVANLKPDMSILDLSGGLGGPARLLSERFGLWINAFDTSAELAEIGMEQSKMAGMTKKVPVESYDPAKPEWQKKKFDFIFSREAFFQIPKKEVTLLAIAKSLKPEGQCLITDLVLREKDLKSKAVDEWIASESQPVQLWTVARYRELFEKLSLPTSLSPQDLTQDYCALIVNGWRKAQAKMAKAKKSGNFDPEVMACLGEEAERWAKRTVALQSGDLQVYRFYSDKKSR